MPTDKTGLWLVIGLLVVTTIVLGVVVLFGGSSNPSKPMNPGPGGGVVCTMEARECPDGSYVGRQGPNCEFAACPSGAKIEIKY